MTASERIRQARQRTQTTSEMRETSYYATESVTGGTFVVADRATNRVAEMYLSREEALARAMLLNGNPVPSELRGRIIRILRHRILASMTPNVYGLSDTAERYSGAQVAYAKGRASRAFNALGL